MTTHTSLGKLGKWGSGGTPLSSKPDYYDGPIPWLMIEDLNDHYVSKSEKSITEVGLKNSSAKLVPANTLLIAMYGSIGKLGINKIPCAMNQAIAFCKPYPDVVDIRYLFFFLLNVRRYLLNEGRGGTQQNINQEMLKDFPISLPKLDQQKRIAAILDKADRLRRQRRFAQSLSDSFLQSVFIKIFGDPVSNPKNWDSCSVDKLCSVVVDCPHTTPKYSEKITHFACIRTSDVQDGLVDWASTKYVSEEEYKIRIARYKPVTGDVLYTREGERYGLAAQVPRFTTVCLGQRMMLLKADPKSSNNEFVCALMNSPLIYRQAEKLVSGSTSPHVNVGDIREFVAIKPPLPIQDKFGDIVKKFERVRRQHREATRQAEHLFQTLLHRAFRGEL